MTDNVDNRTVAARKRAVHREEVLEKMRNAGLVQKILADSERLTDESVVMDAVMVSRIKAANDLRIKMVGKWLPDVKAVEIHDDEGNPTAAVGFVIVPAKS